MQIPRWLRPGRAAISAAAMLALAGLLTTPGTAAAQPSSSSDAFNSVTVESHADWMSGLPSGASLSSLSLPGTHDTLAIHGGLFAAYYEAQENHGDSAGTLDAQLNAGIRALDIRVRVIGGAFTIHHTDIYQNANFDDVLSHARAFLAAHPAETILLKLHGECDADSTEGGSGSASIGHCADDPSNITQADRTRIFDGYVSRYPNLFYAPTVTGSSTAAMPTVGQTRGRIVLTDFTGPRGQVYGGYGLTQLTTGNYGQYVENDWTQCTIGTKWGEAQANMANANGNPSALYTTYLSANCGPFGSTPADVAGSINQRALDYLNSGATQHVGMVFTDFPGHSLVGALIRQQTGQLAGAIPSGVQGKCLDDFGNSATPGAKVDSWSCNGSSAQHWTVMPDRTLRIMGLCLDVAAGGTANGTTVGLWTCTGGTNQQWTSGANGSLIGAQSGKCLDVPGSSTTDGVQVIVWDCSGAANQRWTLP